MGKKGRSKKRKRSEKEGKEIQPIIYNSTSISDAHNNDDHGGHDGHDDNNFDKGKYILKQDGMGETNVTTVGETLHSTICEKGVECVTHENNVKIATEKQYKELDLSVTLEVTEKSSSIQKQQLNLPQPYNRSCLELQNDTANYTADYTDADADTDANTSLSLLKLAKHAFRKISKQKHRHYNSSSKIVWSPTPIQLQSWPILASPDVPSLNLIAISPTGSGKSLAYAIPLVLNGLIQRQIPEVEASASTSTAKTTSHNEDSTTRFPPRRSNAISALIITPTRELTIQVSKVVSLVCKSANKIIEKKQLEYVKDDDANDTNEQYQKKGKKKKMKKKKKKEEKLNLTRNEQMVVGSTTNDVNIMSSIAIYGGVDKSEQIQKLLMNSGTVSTATKNNDAEGEGEGEGISEGYNTNHNMMIVTATPGRLIDLMGLEFKNNDDNGDENVTSNSQKEKVKDMKVGNDLVIQNRSNSNEICNLFQSTKMLIIDEADRVATQSDISKQVHAIVSFLKNIRKKANEELTVGLFSATLPQRASSNINEWVSKPRCTIKVNSLTVGKSENSQNENKSNTLIDKGDDNEVSDSIDDTNLKKPKSIQKEEKEIVKTNRNEEEGSPSSSSKKKKHNERGSLSLSTIPSHVEQILHVCSNHKKVKKLLTTIKKIRDNEQTKERRRRRKGLIIVFFGTVKALQYIHNLLRNENVQSVQLHSQMKQERREFQLNLFRSGKNPILLATDIAARGLHVNNVEYIINYDFPSSLEQYVHRCGRAGRNRVTDELNNANGKVTSTAENTKATVYSFFNRELKPMAKDVVELLRSCNAHVDPNLLSLVPDKDRMLDELSSRAKRRRKNKQSVAKVEETKKNHIDCFDSDEEEFASLQHNRIVLKRASHVSDAESDSEIDNNE